MGQILEDRTRSDFGRWLFIQQILLLNFLHEPDSNNLRKLWQAKLFTHSTHFLFVDIDVNLSEENDASLKQKIHYHLLVNATEPWWLSGLAR